MKFAFVFPGQGSQSVGMMGAYGESAAIRATFAEAADALGEDLWQMVADGPAELLAQTVNTQPLMLTAGIAVYREWIARGGAVPALVAGHSLGEYSALVAAGALDFGDAVRLVRLRAQAMQEAVPQGEGAMAALLGLDEPAADPPAFGFGRHRKRADLLEVLAVAVEGDRTDDPPFVLGDEEAGDGHFYFGKRTAQHDPLVRIWNEHVMDGFRVGRERFSQIHRFSITALFCQRLSL